MRARLTVEAGAAAPLVCELPENQAARLGRNKNNTIVLLDKHASRWHAEIYPEEGRWLLRDCGATNGTRLNGRLVEEPTALEHAHVIAIGEVRLRFSLVPTEQEKTDEMPVPQPPDSHRVVPAPIPDSSATTALQHDELTALFHFMDAALKEDTPRGLIALALDVLYRQTAASVVGFLNLDAEEPLPKIVLPTLANVDIHLSRRLTQKALEENRSVWVASNADRALETESLLAFRDALCVPLGLSPSSTESEEREAPLGALHVYKAGRSLTEREVRFAEVLARHLANSLHLLRSRLVLEADNARLRTHSPAGDDSLIGDSPALRQLRQQIARLAPGAGSVLICGESGVGKELVALALHRQSPRRNGPLIPVNCASIATTTSESELFGHVKGAFTDAVRDRAGCFQLADDGTLFLDEIGELSLECQARLLRVLETKSFFPVGGEAPIKVDVRVLAATNRDLEREVRDRRFRRDLFFRFSTTLKVPPLREHAEDVPALVEHFLKSLTVEHRRRARLSSSALERLQTYSWPGNVRQLRSVLDTAVATCEGEVIHANDLHLISEAHACGDAPPTLNLEELEAWAIRQALTQTGGNNSQAARLLGIHRDTLLAKLKKYGIEKKG
jgi:two-component system, NtrC family, response regulator HydG